MDDVLVNKAASIERCLARIHEEYENFESLMHNQTRQDAIILNLQRAAETAIDMGNRIIRLRHLGVPQNSRDVFVLLQSASIINETLSAKMQKMVGFRNIAVHEYSALNLEIVRTIIEHHLNDFLEFTRILLKL